jgi:hypothetical protein
MLFGIGAVAVKIQVSRFLIHLDLDHIFTRIALYEAGGLATIEGQIYVENAVFMMIRAPALQGSWIGVQGVGELIKQLRGKSVHGSFSELERVYYTTPDSAEDFALAPSYFYCPF